MEWWVKMRAGLSGVVVTVLSLHFMPGYMFAAQSSANWKPDWEATRRAAEKEAKLVIYGPPGADQQKLYTDMHQQTFAAKVFLNRILSRDGQNQFQRLTRENSLRVDIPKEGVINPFNILDPKREYLFTGLEEHKDKINEFRPWLESLVAKK